MNFTSPRSTFDVSNYHPGPGYYLSQSDGKTSDLVKSSLND